MGEKDAIAKLMEEVSRLREENRRLKQELSEKSSESEEKYRMLFEHSGYGALILSPEGVIQDINQTILKVMGIPEEELVGKNIFELPYCREEEKEFMRRLLAQHRKGEFNIVNEVSCQIKGKIHILEFTSASIVVGDKVCCIAILIRDITRRKRYAQRLKKALREKRELLRELHHRVKNNLQVIYSLLNLHERFSGDERIREILREVKTRIRAIGFLHEKLYSSGRSFDRVRCREYLEGIVQNLTSVFYERSRDVKFRFEIEDAELPIKKAVPLGLILNEAVSNSLKHAFPSGKGEIKVRFLREKENLVLTVEDNGVGLPEELPEVPQESLGLRLIKILSHQLGGDLFVEGDGGTRITVKFREEL